MQRPDRPDCSIATTRRSLAFNVEQTVRVAGAVRDRLSTDNWRVLNRLLQLFTRDSPPLDLDDALELIDDALCRSSPSAVSRWRT